MAFIQIIEGRTSRYDEIKALVDDFRTRNGDQSTVRRAIETKDRDDPSRFMVMVFFDSYESAMENSNMPETDEFSKQMGELLDGPPTFHNLDVVDDQTY